MTNILEIKPFKTFIHIFVLFLPVVVFSQKRESWISQPKENWPLIALTNHVQYKNGDTYIHPSFRYAGTGFLINEKGKNYAVTAKHILWIARK